KQGGVLWCAGGGIALASGDPWDDTGNNQPSGRKVFANSSALHKELVPGRFMYDIAHWQSTIGIQRDVATIKRFFGRFESQTDPSVPWTLYKNELPLELDRKDQGPGAPDPAPPYRSGADFYQETMPLEFLQLENRIIENISTNPDTLIEQSTLDTL